MTINLKIKCILTDLSRNKTLTIILILTKKIIKLQILYSLLELLLKVHLPSISNHNNKTSKHSAMDKMMKIIRFRNPRDLKAINLIFKVLQIVKEIEINIRRIT